MSRITGSPDPPLPYTTERAFGNLEFDRPTDMSSAPGTDRLFVVEFSGNVYSFKPDGSRLDLFLDGVNHLTYNFRMLGITFHPDFENNRFCYISYQGELGAENCRRISRFLVSDTEPPRCDPASETVIIAWTAKGHTGGSIKFGPDGHLYVTAGDGGSSFPADENDTGQDLSDLRSSILRIDVDHPAPGKSYSIPPDNPFVDLAGARPEIWAYGFRNPWRISFDPFTGDLWTGDVGWELWEMVQRVERGGNYGWSVKEGPQPVRSDLQVGPTPILPPTIAHPHTESLSITGGYTYRGQRLKELVGAYIYGDYVTGKIWGARHDGTKVTWNEELADTPLAIVSFGEANDGRLFILDHADGTIHRLIPNPRFGQESDFPRRLSETGLFASVSDCQPAEGVIPYELEAEPWQDYATFERFVASPGTSTIVRADNKNRRDLWNYQRDLVFAKTVSLEMERGNPATARRLETQVLHFDGHEWRPYTYIWNEAQTDAELADAAGSQRTFEIIDPDAPRGLRRQTWRYASRAECMACHTRTAGYVIALDSIALPADFVEFGLVDESLAPSDARLCDPMDDSAPLYHRARSYLHVNCAHCHRRSGGGNSPIELLFTHPLDRTRTVGAVPTQGAFGITDARVIAAGDPFESVLYLRMSKLGRGRMPHLGSQYIDRTGTELIAKWIESLDALQGKNGELASVIVSSGNGGTPHTLASPPIDPLASPAAALRTLRDIDRGRIDQAATKELIARATAHTDPVVRDLFERFLPEEQRIERLGTNVDAEQLLSLAGDAEQGRRLFFERADVQCSKCHQIGGQGIAIGPDLSGVGKKQTPAQILENILDPSKTIDPEFVTHVVQTADGQVYSGLLVERTKKKLVLRDAQNKVQTIPLSEVEFTQAQQKSIMPDQLLRDMTAQEAADLLAFLSSLRDLTGE